jgi:hypothetical protein
MPHLISLLYFTPPLPRSLSPMYHGTQDFISDFPGSHMSWMIFGTAEIVMNRHFCSRPGIKTGIRAKYAQRSFKCSLRLTSNH